MGGSCVSDDDREAKQLRTLAFVSKQVTSFLHKLNAEKGAILPLPRGSSYVQKDPVRLKHDEIRDKLQRIQNEIHSLKERSESEENYEELIEHLYRKRYEIVNGEIDLLKSFWLGGMYFINLLRHEITDRDVAALKFLKDIKSCTINNPKGFKLEFVFDSNPYFENTVLTKTFHTIYNIGDKRPTLKRTIGTEIKWHPSENLTKKIEQRKVKVNGITISYFKDEDCGSFFNFFKSSSFFDELDDSDVINLPEHTVEIDYVIGLCIRDELIPNSIALFYGDKIERTILCYNSDSAEDEYEIDDWQAKEY